MGRDATAAAAVAVVVAALMVSPALATTTPITLGSLGSSTTIGSAHPYTNSLDDVWIITASSTTIVQLVFTDMQLETCCDRVTVSDSLDGVTWNDIATYTSLQGPVVSRGRYMKVLFHTDSSVTQHGWDATVTAKTPTTCAQFYANADATPPAEGTTRLVNGATAADGAVEIYYTSSGWTSVCSSSFSGIDMQAVCRNLGCASGAATLTTWSQSAPTQELDGANNYGVSSVTCTGMEDSLDQCVHDFGTYSCSNQASGRCTDCSSCSAFGSVSSQESAPVIGGTAPTEQCSGALRLASETLSSPTSYSVTGRLEWYDGSWGTVCDDGFTSGAARIACNQLGCSGGEYSSGNNDNSNPPDIGVDDVYCDGDESFLDHCDYSTSNNCGHSEVRSRVLWCVVLCRVVSCRVVSCVSPLWCCRLPPPPSPSPRRVCGHHVACHISACHIVVVRHHAC